MKTWHSAGFWEHEGMPGGEQGLSVQKRKGGAGR